MTAIDLGCGDNKVNPYFIGVDKRPTKETNIVSEADDLSAFSEGSVNVVFSRRCIQHIADDMKVFREINRVLAPNGVAIIEVASVSNALVSKLLNRLGIKKHPYTVFQVYTRNTLRSKLELSGLKIVSLSLSPTDTPLFRNHVAVCIKGQNEGISKEAKLS
jgi:ubiquinone/menaquinone biosynthesis C-methylase UbiE